MHEAERGTLGPRGGVAMAGLLHMVYNFYIGILTAEASGARYCACSILEKSDLL